MTSKYAPKNLIMEDFVSTTLNAMTTKSAKSANVFLRQDVKTTFHKVGVVGVTLAERVEEMDVFGGW